MDSALCMRSSSRAPLPPSVAHLSGQRLRAVQLGSAPPQTARTAARCDAGAERESRRSRRDVLLSVPAALAVAPLVGAAALPRPAVAVPSFTPPPQGYRLFLDRFDGYSFYVPDTWQQVRGSGQDCFFRSPVALDENISVQVSSPSSSRFESVADLGSPEDAGQQVLKQYLVEFMSTRLGVRRDSQLVSAAARTAPDGNQYYDLEVNVKSYANNNQMAILPEERPQMLEWDRHYLTVLGVANRRLYQLRAQVPERILDAQRAQLQSILGSFQAFEVNTL